LKIKAWEKESERIWFITVTNYVNIFCRLKS
jgi:hypothetical protein